MIQIYQYNDFVAKTIFIRVIEQSETLNKT